MTTQIDTALELGDIQAAALMPRPIRTRAPTWRVRIDDRHAGRELLRRLIPLLDPVAAFDPARPVSLGVGLSYSGLEALGVPRAVPGQLRVGVPAGHGRPCRRRSATSGETRPSTGRRRWAPRRPPGAGRAGPRHRPAGGRDRPPRPAYARLPGVPRSGGRTARTPDRAEQFGFSDGISHPAVEGSGIPGSNPQEAPLKAGEFVLGYPRRDRRPAPDPQPDVLGRNGTYVVFRKLHQRVAAFRRYLSDKPRTPREEELLAAKMMGRWRSGAPLALAPGARRPDAGRRPARNNAFLYGDDPRGLNTPGRLPHPPGEPPRRGRRRRGRGCTA